MRLVEVRSDAAPDLPMGARVERAWEDVRCRQCRRLLAKVTKRALRPEELVEIKCPSCNTRNYLAGYVGDDAA